MKVFTLIRTKTPQELKFSKMPSKVDIHENGDFENPCDQCERTETEVFESAPIFYYDFHKTGTI